VRFIRRNLRLAPVPTIPAIRLYTADKETGLRRLAEAADDGTGVSAPYWAYPWAGGMALARYVLDNPAKIRGRRVLDLGTGSGLAAIAAAMAGASEVGATDIDPYAVAAAGMNACENGVVILVTQCDVTRKAPPSVDLIIAGDVFYERSLAARMLGFLDRCREHGIEVLIGDPGRAYLPRPRLRQLAEYAVPDMGLPNAAPKPSAVFTLEAAPRPET
jgi:predicted nicotinamide N-methyase